MNPAALTELWHRTRASLLAAFPDIDPETLRDTVDGELPPAILFATRREARDFIKSGVSSWARRDLRAEPHGWLAPKVVRVTVSVVEQSR